MGQTTIEWTSHQKPDGTIVPGYSFNPWLGCTRISEGCRHCYAEAWAKRSGLVQWGDQAERRRTSASYWRQPLKWNREAEKAGERWRVFCASLADVFEHKPELMPWRSDLLRLIHGTPNLDWLLLTKRPENWMAHLNAALVQFDSEGDTEMIRFASGWLTGSRVPKNVWLGASVENQEQADKRIPELLKIPARVRFLSCEPLLGHIAIEDYLPRYGCGRRCHHSNNKADLCGEGGIIEFPAIEWVIVGGESGPKARPMHPDWARSLRSQCQTMGVPFFFKQHGEWLHWSQAKRWKDSRVADWEAHGSPITGFTDERVHIWGDNTHSYRVGKKNAGRLLDGVEHSEFPDE